MWLVVVSFSSFWLWWTILPQTYIKTILWFFCYLWYTSVFVVVVWGVHMKARTKYIAILKWVWGVFFLLFKGRRLRTNDFQRKQNWNDSVFMGLCVCVRVDCVIMGCLLLLLFVDVGVFCCSFYVCIECEPFDGSEGYFELY